MWTKILTVNSKIQFQCNMISLGRDIIEQKNNFLRKNSKLCVSQYLQNFDSNTLVITLWHIAGHVNVQCSLYARQEARDWLMLEWSRYWSTHKSLKS